MVVEIAKFDLNEETKTLAIDFLNTELNDENILDSLDVFEKTCHNLCSDKRFNFLIIRAQKNTSGPGICFHAYFKDALDVRVISKWEKIVTFIEKVSMITIISLQNGVSETMLQLALVCDHRICAEDSVYQFHAIQHGYLPGMAVFRLSKYVGLGRAKQLLFIGEKLSAQEALQHGLVDEVVVDNDTAIHAFIKKIQPKQIEAIIMARRLLNESFHDSYEDEIGDYLAAQVRCIEHLKFFKDE